MSRNLTQHGRHDWAKQETPPVERDERTMDWVDEQAHGTLMPDEQTNAAPQTGQVMVASNGQTVSLMVRKQTLLAELQGLIKHSVETHFEIGRRLTELQSLAEHGEFLKLLQGPLWGFSPSRAYQHIDFFKRCQQFPSLQDMAERHYTKAIALFNTLDEEQLQAFAEGRLPEITADDLDQKSVSELKKELKKLKRDVGQIVREETAALMKERDEVIKERDEAQAKLNPPNWKFTKAMAEEVAKLSEKLGAQVAALLDSMPKTEPLPTELLFGIEASLFRAQTAAETAWSRFQTVKGEE